MRIELIEKDALDCCEHRLLVVLFHSLPSLILLSPIYHVTSLFLLSSLIRSLSPISQYILIFASASIPLFSPLSF